MTVDKMQVENVKVGINLLTNLLPRHILLISETKL